ncbi:hypothetical protein BcepSauron_048 [Burkholderia phage BcepSauron]|uniref:Uncharacterized protein n=2 Tax=Sarumanvirus TaxID=2843450 RepID=A0A482MLC7_9CAUD|nr:hypothetical protein H1O16_gp047 [Burkholderia phage BcepSaruman]YP_009904426.1 hypothetical protein H1O17_gp048 [Burkholderia phage BcepSauron]QBQ74428.1 hypothetical protein BcepSauron_048 [Burkholderia phage BcepSauron]QBX06460.1 hypothetical protein BcepSaruman_047 [Burkholderia phage BcepSaruman]
MTAITLETIPNPVIARIPEGAVVTVHLSSGHSLTGTDDTTEADAADGLFILYECRNVVVSNPDPRQRNTITDRVNTRRVLLASDIIGFSMDYEPA